MVELPAYLDEQALAYDPDTKATKTIDQQMEEVLSHARAAAEHGQKDILAYWRNFWHYLNRINDRQKPSPFANIAVKDPS